MIVVACPHSSYTSLLLSHSLSHSPIDSIHPLITPYILTLTSPQVDKLNSLINGSEREMIRLRQAYADAVEHRNMTGIQLIDRNDELCILHEKFNIQVRACACVCICGILVCVVHGCGGRGRLASCFSQ